jgi:tetratricopeptide (TPR) repeat protein
MRMRHALLAATLLGAVTLAHAATPEDLADVEAQAQYAFLTEDAAALRRLSSDARALATSERALELYHFAHLQFRALQLATFDGRRRDATEAGAACVALLERAVALEPASAEALALQGTCHAYLAALAPVTGLPSAARASARVAAAARLAPRNPRVQLAEASALYFRPPGLGGDRTRALPLLERAARAFEAMDVPRAGEPTWGAADAWFLVGRAREESGDVLAARDAYEKALLIAPDFARAKRRLTHLTRP